MTEIKIPWAHHWPETNVYLSLSSPTPVQYVEYVQLPYKNRFLGWQNGTIKMRQLLHSD